MSERFTTDLAFIIVVLLVAAILGFLLAWFIRQAKINALLSLQRAAQNEVGSKDEKVVQTPDGQTSAGETMVSDNPSHVETATPSTLFDATEAKKIIGKRVKEDDLTVVEGIGPKIAKLFASNEIDTWEKLATKDADSLNQLLHAAGSRFKMHDATTWPQQAQLASEAKWEELKALQDGLTAGRPA